MQYYHHIVDVLTLAGCDVRTLENRLFDNHGKSEMEDLSYRHLLFEVRDGSSSLNRRFLHESISTRSIRGMVGES